MNVAHAKLKSSLRLPLPRLSVSRLPLLRLSLLCNKITAIAPGAFQGLTSLHTLDLRFNLIGSDVRPRVINRLFRESLIGIVKAGLEGGVRPRVSKSVEESS